jgi:hypothetical protein
MMFPHGVTACTLKKYSRELFARIHERDLRLRAVISTMQFMRITSLASLLFQCLKSDRRYALRTWCSQWRNQA